MLACLARCSPHRASRPTDTKNCRRAHHAIGLWVCQGKSPLIPVLCLNCLTKNDLRISGGAAAGADAWPCAARGLSSRLGVPGRRGDAGDGGTCGQAVCGSREMPRHVMGGMWCQNQRGLDVTCSLLEPDLWPGAYPYGRVPEPCGEFGWSCLEPSA